MRHLLHIVAVAPAVHLLHREISKEAKSLSTVSFRTKREGTRSTQARQGEADRPWQPPRPRFQIVRYYRNRTGLSAFRSEYNCSGESGDSLRTRTGHDSYHRNQFG